MKWSEVIAHTELSNLSFKVELNELCPSHRSDSHAFADDDG